MQNIKKHSHNLVQKTLDFRRCLTKSNLNGMAKDETLYSLIYTTFIVSRAFSLSTSFGIRASTSSFKSNKLGIVGPQNTE